ncbi:MAG: hypothetical protein IJE59_04270 [Clostridia bacterium]|nr:hypothetical protein [Clostridia bacterium]
MKYLDKLLKKLKTDRNTFFTYIFTLLTAYILIDRVVEMLILFFTGMSVSYWGPIKYTFALACPIFAFLFSYPSKFCKSDGNKISFFSTYCICLYVIGISAIVQWINNIAWIGILSLPNYEVMITEFSDLIKNAFTAVSVAIPLVTFYKLILWLNRTVNDPIFPNNFQESICDFQGLDIAAPDGTTGPYSLEIEICKDRTTGKPVKLIESRRFQPMVVIGPSGTGKTSMVMEPMIARDLEKKFFFREVSKEMGYTALKTNIAVLNKPYDNDYLNKNFHLSMLTPVEGKERIYKAYMNKMISEVTPDGKIIYKNFGITVISPDSDHTDRVREVANNFDIPVIEIDPTNPNSIGINPFTIGNPALCGLIISLALRGLYDPAGFTAEMAYAEDISIQAIQNLVILLKVMYPKMNDGLMPNLQDLLKCFTDFSLVQEMCEEMKKDEELAKEYDLQLGYFKQYFYEDAVGKKDMQKYVHFVSSTLDTLLRSAEARNIICNRYNNIDFNDVLNNGKVVLISTRPYEIGGAGHKGFGNFFLMVMMCAVENGRKLLRHRIPHFMYVDEFNSYSTDALSDMYTIYRKFKIGTIFSAQTISSLGQKRDLLLTNAPTKITFGNSTPEEMSWWMNEFGKRKEWNVGYSYDKQDGEYSEKLGGPSWDWVDHMKLGKIQGLKFKGVIYKIKNKKGKNVVNFGTVDFLESKYKAPHKSKKYNFSKYITAVKSEDDKEEKIKWNPKKVKFKEDERGDVDPVQTNTTDSSYFFDNADAISFNLGNNNNEQ